MNWQRHNDKDDHENKLYSQLVSLLVAAEGRERSLSMIDDVGISSNMFGRAKPSVIPSSTSTACS